MFIVTFADVKRALDHSFSELLEKSSPLPENGKKGSDKQSNSNNNVNKHLTPAVNPNATSFMPQSMQTANINNIVNNNANMINNIMTLPPGTQEHAIITENICYLSRMFWPDFNHLDWYFLFTSQHATYN